MDLGLGGKVALVTGVSYGIGAAIADVLIGEGVQVFGTSRTVPAERAGLLHASIDMSRADAGEQAVDGCLAEFGRLDVLVNNVGHGRIGTGFSDESDEIWQQYWELNFMSAVRAARAALRPLLERGGVIVNVSSVNGRMPQPGIYSYTPPRLR